MWNKFIEKLRHYILKKLDYELIYNIVTSYKKYNIDIIKEIPEHVDFAKEDSPVVSIIIPVYNQFEFTIKCLQSIKQATSVPYEIILIDDCSTDSTRNLENYVSNITIIHNEHNLGFLRNCNLAAKYAKGKYIYLLNNDTQVLPQAIDMLVETFNLKSNCGAVGSKLIYPNGKLQSAGAMVTPKGARTIGGKENPLDKNYNYLREVDFCCGASLMFPSEIWNRLGGFDELFVPGYYEETDLCLQIKEMGYKCYYQPLSEVIHFASQSYSHKASELMKINKVKFYNKWKAKLINKRI